VIAFAGIRSFVEFSHQVDIDAALTVVPRA
jgi:hypothetical protein